MREYAQFIEDRPPLGEGSVHEEEQPAETVRQRVDRSLQFTATCREHTHDNCATMVRRHADPAIGVMPVVDLKRSDMRGVVEAMRAKNLSRSAINNVIAPSGTPWPKGRRTALSPKTPPRS